MLPDDHHRDHHDDGHDAFNDHDDHANYECENDGVDGGHNEYGDNDDMICNCDFDSKLFHNNFLGHYRASPFQRKGWGFSK